MVPPSAAHPPAPTRTLVPPLEATSRQQTDSEFGTRCSAFPMASRLGLSYPSNPIRRNDGHLYQAVRDSWSFESLASRPLGIGFWYPYAFRPRQADQCLAVPASIGDRTSDPRSAWNSVTCATGDGLSFAPLVWGASADWEIGTLSRLASTLGRHPISSKSARSLVPRMPLNWHATRRKFAAPTSARTPPARLDFRQVHQSLPLGLWYPRTESPTGLTA